MREKAAVKNEIMKREKQKTGQKWRSKLKKMQHEKLQHKKSATEEEMQRENGATWKKVQYEKSAQKVQHENIATQKTVRDEKSAPQKKFMMKTLWHEKNKTKIVQLKRTATIRCSKVQHVTTQKSKI